MLLVIAIGIVGVKTYQLWGEDQQGLAKPSKKKAPLRISVPKQEAVNARLVNVRSIVERNLFDPNRGAVNAKETENLSQGKQAMEGLALLGIVIVGSKRYAILKIPSNTGSGASRGKRRAGSKRGTRGEHRRLALGDMLDGYKLSEIHAQKVVFKKGPDTVELTLDFSRRAGR